MKFGSVFVLDAEGTVLAHGLKLPDGRMKKGRVLSAADIARISKAGIEDVIVAQLDERDVQEDLAASQIASLLAHNSITMGEPFTGRVNLYAAYTGILQVNKDLINRMNRISPAITLATLPEDSFVEHGRMVGTIKIIPFAVAGQFLSEVEKMVAQRTVISVARSRSMKVGLVSTVLPSLKTSVMDKTKQALEDRLSPSGSAIVAEARVDHTEPALSSALQDLADECDMVIVFGASAITDVDDVIPAAVRRCGGVIEHLGMPVDPGNLLLIGSIKGKPVIGAPGCARSPAENGFDWVLQRLIAGLPVDKNYITGLGVGGLLMEITARPQPREG